MLEYNAGITIAENVMTRYDIKRVEKDTLYTSNFIYTYGTYRTLFIN
jgi:hypothetical protein